MKKIKIECTGTESIDLDDFTELQGNLKELTDENYEKLKKSILKYGFSFPMFVWKNKNVNYIVDAHQRKKTLKNLEAEGYDIPPLPTVFINAKSKKEAKEKLLQLNSNYGKITQDGFYEFLNEPGAELDFSDLDISLPDFDMVEFEDKFLTPEDDSKDDEVPEVPENPVSVLGDLWLLGEHRVMCGDSTDPGSVAILMNGQKADLVFTDPPYNIDYGISKNPRHRIRSIENDSMNTSEWCVFCKKLFENFKEFNTGDIYMWGASGPEGMMMRLWLVEMGAHWSATIIWKKQQLVLSPAKYQRMYEPCFYGWFEKSSFCADRKQTEVWEFNRPQKSDLHPTMKPIDLCAYGIKNSSKRGGVVLDLFLGSGSTLIACEKTNRKCYGMELDTHYTDVIVKRWEDYTGKIAKHENGKTFDEIEQERL